MSVRFKVSGEIISFIDMVENELMVQYDGESFTDDIFTKIQASAVLRGEYDFLLIRYGSWINSAIAKELKKRHHLRNTNSRCFKPMSSLIKSYQRLRV